MNEFLPRGKRLWAERREWSDSIDFVLFERRGDSVSYSTSISMFNPGTENAGEIIAPTFSLKNDEAQELMDNLWKLGFRPSEGTGSAGSLAATQKHLEDMRRLVFDFLDTKNEN